MPKTRARYFLAVKKDIGGDHHGAINDWFALLDNTLIIYIVGDNGTSPEGTLGGTPNQWTAYNGILDFPVTEQIKFYDAWGSADSYPHMAVGWSWAFDTPFKWTKEIGSHFGGTRQGMAISWPIV